MNSTINEERYEFVLWLYRIRAQSNGHYGFLQPDFIWVMIRPYMSSKYHRSDDDIMEAVDLWCDDPTAAEAMYGHISNWDTSLVTTMKNLFNGNTWIGGKANRRTFNEDISRWNVSAVTTMLAMFYLANAFNGDISQWDVSAVTSMDNMFNSANAFNGDISQWNVSAVTNMKLMFHNCPIAANNKPTFEEDVE